MQMQGSFDANAHMPNQGFGNHPPANKIPFRITAADIKENAAKDGGFYEVEFTSPQGSILMRYNIWNKSAKAVEIAHGQLSALCRAINIYNINWQDGGKAIIGGQGLMDVGYQKGEEPSADNPNAKGYTELKRVYDVAGNDPSKPASAQQPQTMQPAQQTAAQPMTQQPGGGWGQPNAAQAQAAQTVPQGQAWQPGQNGGAAPGGTPPWGNR
jgi:hypothetical protein